MFMAFICVFFSMQKEEKNP